MDIKPENIMLSNEGHIKIIDFGLSCHFVKGRCLPYHGTKGYIPPEIENKDILFINRVDIWSCGSTLLCMLGHLLFSNEEYINWHFSEWRLEVLNGIEKKNQTKLIEKFSQEQQKKIVAFSELVFDMLSYYPEDRPTTSKILQKIHLILKTEN